jgi:hypothetical protein
LAGLSLSAVLVSPIALQASSFSALNIDFLGRGGGTYGLVGRNQDIDNVIWNASGLGFGSDETGFGGYMDYIVQLKGGIAGYSSQYQQKGAYGLYMSYLTSGMISRTEWDDPTGGTGDEFSHGEFVFGASGGFRVTSYLSGGVGLKLARQSTDNVSSGGLFGDLSGSARIYPLEAGEPGPGVKAFTTIVFRNLEITRWGEEAGDPPANAELGLAIESPQAAWVGGGSYYVAREGRREVRLGLSAKPSEEFEVRFGYRRRIGDRSDSGAGFPWHRGLSAGFGVGFGKIWVDYTYEDASPLDNIHRFALRAIVGPPG